MPMSWLTRLAALVALAHTSSAFVFQVADDTVNECGPAAFTWSKGTAPYSIAVISEFDVATLYDIPTNDIVEVDGLLNYNWTLPYDAGNRTVFIMSDATGFATGGASGMYTVGARPAGASCTLRSEEIFFFFGMSPDTNELSQCGSVDFRWTANSGFSIQYPITVTGVIPNGQVFQWNTTADSTSYTPISIAAGTQVLFSAWDAAGNQAGTSRLQSILESGNGGCLDANSPAYTSVVYPVPTPTVSGSAGASGTSVDVPATSTRRTGVITVTATTIAKGAAGLSGGAIAGIVIGALAGFAILQAIIIWFCCRRHISDMRKQRQQQRMRLATGGVDLYEGSFSSDAEHTMSMNNRRVSLHDIDGAGTIDPFLGGSDPRSSAYTDGDLSLYAPGAHMSGTGTGSPRSSHHPSAPWNDSSAPSSPVTGPSGYASRIPTKLQLAMQNPDNAMFEDEQPRTEAPVGGFRRHEDAGRLGDAPTPEGDVEELPPNYNPAWETDSQK